MYILNNIIKTCKYQPLIHYRNIQKYLTILLIILMLNIYKNNRITNKLLLISNYKNIYNLMIIYKLIFLNK